MAEEEKEKKEKDKVVGGGSFSGQPPVKPPAAKKARVYIVRGAVRHDGEDYKSGEVIELEHKHAKPLLAVGAIREKDDEE